MHCSASNPHILHKFQFFPMLFFPMGFLLWVFPWFPWFVLPMVFLGFSQHFLGFSVSYVFLMVFTIFSPWFSLCFSRWSHPKLPGERVSPQALLRGRHLQALGAATNWEDRRIVRKKRKKNRKIWKIYETYMKNMKNMENIWKYMKNMENMEYIWNIFGNLENIWNIYGKYMTNIWNITWICMDMYGKNKGNRWKYWGKLTLEIIRDTRSLTMEIILEWSL